jgi:transposase
MASYLPYEPQQQMLLPEALQDWLPEGHLAYFIGDAVDGLDLSAFHARYAGGGPRNQPFHPAMMVKVLVYAYASGVFSSRKIAKKFHEDVAFRVLGAGNFPAHRTISDFRAFHLKEFSELFVQVVRLAREMGLVKLGTIAVDGTKVKANASRHKAMSYSHMLKAEGELKAQIAALLSKAKSADEAEKNEPELDIPAEIARRQDRLHAIEQARQRLEQRQREADIERGRSDDDDCKPRGKDGKPKGGRYKREFGKPEDSAQENFTDPDSRIMKRAGGGYDASYNAQTAVDDAAHIIVAAELTNNASDAGELPTMLHAVKDNLGRWPEQALADTGYRSEQVFQALAGCGTELVVALGREGKQQLRFDPHRRPHTAQMAAKLQSDKGKAAYRRRKWIAEPPNGWVKSVLGLRQFSMRGLHRVQAEWKLVCMALNLRRMCTLQAA